MTTETELLPCPKCKDCWALRRSFPDVVIEHINCGRCGFNAPTKAWQARTPSPAQPEPEMYEDELPANMPKGDYNKWYAQSRLSNGNIGVRVGPRYPPAQPEWLPDGAADEVQRRMDAVVEAAVADHCADEDWAEAADALSAAVESLLEPRQPPKGDDQQ